MTVILDLETNHFFIILSLRHTMLVFLLNCLRFNKLLDILFNTILVIY